MKKFSFALMTLILTGCAGSNSAVNASMNAPAPQIRTVPSETNRTVNNIEMCKNQLEALKSFNPASYANYQASFQSISNQTKKYISIQKSIGEEINSLALPKFQFSIREVCFKIKNELSSSIIKNLG